MNRPELNVERLGLPERGRPRLPVIPTLAGDNFSRALSDPPPNLLLGEGVSRSLRDIATFFPALIPVTGPTFDNWLAHLSGSPEATEPGVWTALVEIFKRYPAESITRTCQMVSGKIRKAASRRPRLPEHPKHTLKRVAAAEWATAQILIGAMSNGTPRKKKLAKDTYYEVVFGESNQGNGKKTGLSSPELPSTQAVRLACIAIYKGPRVAEVSSVFHALERVEKGQLVFKASFDEHTLDRVERELAEIDDESLEVHVGLVQKAIKAIRTYEQRAPSPSKEEEAISESPFYKAFRFLIDEERIDLIASTLADRLIHPLIGLGSAYSVAPAVVRLNQIAVNAARSFTDDGGRLQANFIETLEEKLVRVALAQPQSSGEHVKNMFRELEQLGLGWKARFQAYKDRGRTSKAAHLIKHCFELLEGEKTGFKQSDPEMRLTEYAVRKLKQALVHLSLELNVDMMSVGEQIAEGKAMLKPLYTDEHVDVDEENERHRVEAIKQNTEQAVGEVLSTPNQPKTAKEAVVLVRKRALEALSRSSTPLERAKFAKVYKDLVIRTGAAGLVQEAWDIITYTSNISVDQHIEALVSRAAQHGSYLEEAILAEAAIFMCLTSQQQASLQAKVYKKLIGSIAKAKESELTEEGLRVVARIEELAEMFLDKQVIMEQAERQQEREPNND